MEYIKNILIEVNPDIINKICKILIIIIITKCISLLLKPNSPIFKMIVKNSKNKTVNAFLNKLIQVILWITATYMIIYELGYDLSGLVTGLGIGSVVIALAAQDMVKSLLSGIAIITDKPFLIGDCIEVGNYTGTVIQITYRSTRIKTEKNTIVTIPNSTITSSYVVNLGKGENKSES